MDTDHLRIPIMELCEQLVVPLQGDVTDEIAARLLSDVLDRIRSCGARGLVLDLTGVWLLDSHLCSVLSRLAAAARLMGTRSVICGMNPDTALTLQTMGIGVGFAATALRLEDALEVLGVHVTMSDPDDDTDGDDGEEGEHAIDG